MDCVKIGKLIAKLRKEKGLTQQDSGNIDKVQFFVCPSCGNILTGTGSASIFCCGRKLEPLVSVAQEKKMNLSLEEIDTDYYISVDHPMEKTHYLSFAAYVKSDGVYLKRMYPEQNPAFRIPMSLGRDGKLYLYCTGHGLISFGDLRHRIKSARAKECN